MRCNSARASPSTKLAIRRRSDAWLNNSPQKKCAPRSGQASHNLRPSLPFRACHNRNARNASRAQSRGVWCPARKGIKSRPRATCLKTCRSQRRLNAQARLDSTPLKQFLVEAGVVEDAPVDGASNARIALKAPVHRRQRRQVVALRRSMTHTTVQTVAEEQKCIGAQQHVGAVDSTCNR